MVKYSIPFMQRTAVSSQLEILCIWSISFLSNNRKPLELSRTYFGVNIVKFQVQFMFQSLCSYIFSCMWNYSTTKMHTTMYTLLISMINADFKFFFSFFINILLQY